MGGRVGGEEGVGGSGLRGGVAAGDSAVETK